MNLQTLVDLYLERREIDQISIRTLHKEQWMCRKLLNNMDDVALEAITPIHITRFLRNIRQKNGDPYSVTTIDGFTPLFKQLFGHAVEIGAIDKSPAAHLKRKPPSQIDSRIAPAGAVDTVISRLDEYILANHGLPHIIRDAFVVSFSADSGARRGEIHQLKLSQVQSVLAQPQQTPHGNLYIIRSSGKTGDVKLRFGERTASYLQRYIALRPLTSSDMLLVNPLGKHLHVVAINTTFHRVCSFCGVPSFQPHGVRHLNITEMMRNGADRKVAASYANHRSEKITLSIYRHIVANEVDDFAAALINRRDQEDVKELAKLFGLN